MYYDYSFLRLVPAFIWAVSIILGMATLAWSEAFGSEKEGEDKAQATLFFGCCFVAAGLPMGKMLYWIAVNMIGL